MELGPGAQVGNYQIVEQAGRGGMATVYKAFQPALNRFVAVKVLPAFFAEDQNFLERFRQEAQTVSQLRHPNILFVFDFGEQDGVTYMVSEFLPGGTLERFLGQPLSVAQAITFIKPIANALDYAHARGMIHRDVKPSNVLLTEDDQPVLSDFGVARMVAGSSRLTATGVAVGTPEYMAPEQAAGDPTTPASDRYALGIVLYEMLTGRTPFQAETPVAVALAHMHQPLPLPRTLNPALSEAVEAVLVKALAKKPDERYGSAREMVEALEAAASTSPTLVGTPAAVAASTAATVMMAATPPANTAPAATPAAAPASAVAGPVQPPRRRHWPLAVGILGLLGLIGVLAAVFIWRPGGITGTQGQSTRSAAPAATTAARPAAPTATPAARPAAPAASPQAAAPPPSSPQPGAPSPGPGPAGQQAAGPGAGGQPAAAPAPGGQPSPGPQAGAPSPAARPAARPGERLPVERVLPQFAGRIIPPPERDDFSSPANGLFNTPSQSPNGRIAYESGSLVLEYSRKAATDSVVLLAPASRPASFSNGILDFEARVLAGGDQAAFRIFVRRSPNGSGYSVAVTPRRRQVALYKHIVPERLDTLASATVDSLLPDGNNRLIVVADGADFQVLINGQPALVSHDEAYSNGQLALAASPGGGSNLGDVRIAFDDFRMVSLR